MTGINLRLIPGEDEFVCVCERVHVIVVCYFCVAVVYNRSQRDWKKRGLTERVCVCVLVCLCLFVVSWRVCVRAWEHTCLWCSEQDVTVCVEGKGRYLQLTLAWALPWLG